MVLQNIICWEPNWVIMILEYIIYLFGFVHVFILTYVFVGHWSDRSTFWIHLRIDSAKVLINNRTTPRLQLLCFSWEPRRLHWSPQVIALDRFRQLHQRLYRYSCGCVLFARMCFVNILCETLLWLRSPYSELTFQALRETAILRGENGGAHD